MTRRQFIWFLFLCITLTFSTLVTIIEVARREAKEIEQFSSVSTLMMLKINETKYEIRHGIHLAVFTREAKYIENYNQKLADFDKEIDELIEVTPGRVKDFLYSSRDSWDRLISSDLTILRFIEEKQFEEAIKYYNSIRYRQIQREVFRHFDIFTKLLLSDRRDKVKSGRRAHIIIAGISVLGIIFSVVGMMLSYLQREEKIP
jgi:hypothetical protein